MGAIKYAMQVWMEEENISPEQLSEMIDVNKQFSIWLLKKMEGKEAEYNGL